MSTTGLNPVLVAEGADVVEALRFLSDGNRLRIVMILAQRESCVGDLIEQLGLAQPLVSYHLRRLREMGLVRARRKAQWVFYSLEPEVWARFTQPIREVCAVLDLPPAAMYGATDTCGAVASVPLNSAESIESWAK